MTLHERIVNVHNTHRAAVKGIVARVVLLLNVLYVE